MLDRDWEAGLGPQDLGSLTPSPPPTFLLYSQSNLCSPLGIEWSVFCPGGPSVLVSSDDCAKTLVPSAKPWEACKQELGCGAGSLGAVSVLGCALSSPQQGHVGAYPSLCSGPGWEGQALILRKGS